MSNHLDDYKTSYSHSFKYHEENIALLNWYSQMLIRRLKELNSKSLISLGLGHGVVCTNIIETLGDTLQQYTVLEGSAEIIRDYKDNHTPPEQVQFVHTLFENYAPAQKVDVIDMGFILEHVDDPLLVLKKYAAYLKPGGTVFASVPNARALNRTIGYEAGMLDSIYKLSEEDINIGHQRYFDLAAFTKLITDAGLKIQCTEGIYLKPFSTGQMQGLQLKDEVVEALFKVARQYPEISMAMYIEALA